MNARSRIVPLADLKLTTVGTGSSTLPQLSGASARSGITRRPAARAIHDRLDAAPIKARIAFETACRPGPTLTCPVLT